MKSIPENMMWKARALLMSVSIVEESSARYESSQAGFANVDRVILNTKLYEPRQLLYTS